MIALTALFTLSLTANAMSYEQARDQALFLTDKMAYELNLTEDQYEAAYEINLDYLLSVESVDDLYGIYWERRNLDLSYILLDWQYQNYLAASYFYRPLYWDAGFWHFGIYARYPYRTWFYFGRPAFYFSYHGGHSWHHNGGRSWYHGRTFGNSHRMASGHHGQGMRNGYDRGDYNDRHGNYERNGSRGLERRDGGMNGRNVRNNDTRTRNGVGNDTYQRGGGNFGGSRSTQRGSRPSSTRQSTGAGNDRSVNPQRSTTTPQRSTVTAPTRTFTPSNSRSETQQRSTTSPSVRERNNGTSSRGTSSVSRPTTTQHALAQLLYSTAQCLVFSQCVGSLSQQFILAQCVGSFA